jgi:hypothetical protein
MVAFSVKDRYQLIYFICIKDLNTEAITSLKWNLFSFFIGCCQHCEMKNICLYIFLISDRYCGPEHQYLYSRFLGVSILQLRCHNNSVNTGSRLPSTSDVKTRKMRNMVGIDMIRNNHKWHDCEFGINEITNGFL